MKFDKSKNVAFSGHRSFKTARSLSLFCGINSLSLEPRLDEVLQELITEGYNTFLSGMAEGFDLLAAGAVLRIRNFNRHVRLIAVVPYRGQAAGFDDDSRSRYHELLDQADEVVMLSESYYEGCFHRRNDFLLENSSYLVCYYNGAAGGTKYTVERARKLGTAITNLCEE